MLMEKQQSFKQVIEMTSCNLIVQRVAVKQTWHLCRSVDPHMTSDRQGADN
jgi:hypothetical protein